MKFRPCIDLKGGKVVQIVGGTLTDDGAEENYVSRESAGSYGELYKRDGLRGGHVIMLGTGNDGQAREALAAFPGGFHVGGGVTAANAQEWLDAGASHVIVTSYVFHDGDLDEARLDDLVSRVGKDRLVLDLSCRKKSDGEYYVVTDRWQKFTNLRVDATTLERLSERCAEFLVHGVDVEGKKLGVDEDLVSLLGAHATIPVTYAGGARSLDDLALVKRLGQNKVDLTIGSSLDIFGGSLPYADVLQWHQAEASS